MPAKPIYRRCQECGYVQKDFDPDSLTTEKARNAFYNRECKRCGSPAFDRGTFMVRKTEDWEH